MEWLIILVIGIVAIQMLPKMPRAVPTPQEARVIAEFRKRKIRQWLLTIPAVPIVGGGFYMRAHPNAINCISAQLFLVIGFGFAIASLLFSFSNWRCPACDRYLGRGANPVQCKNCRARLQ